MSRREDDIQRLKTLALARLSQRKELVESSENLPARSGGGVPAQPLPERPVDLGNIDQLEARRAAKGWMSSGTFQRRSKRTIENIDALRRIDKASIKAIRTKIEMVSAQKELMRGAGLIDQLPEKDRLEVHLEIAKLRTEGMRERTEGMRERREQAELAREIRQLETEPPSAFLETLKRIESKLDSPVLESGGAKKLTGVDAVVDKMTTRTQDLSRLFAAMEVDLAAIDEERAPELYEQVRLMWENRILQETDG